MTTSRTFRLLPSGGVACAGILAVALGASGCAGATPSLRPARFDVRGSALVIDREPRMLVAGPVQLLHVDVDKKRDVALFRVPRRPGSEVDCRQDGIAVEADGFARSGTSRLYLDVAADEAVCLSVLPGGDGSRKVNVSWHARGGERTAKPAVNLAAN